MNDKAGGRGWTKEGQSCRAGQLQGHLGASNFRSGRN